jgi:hypothetical protein
MVTNNKAESVNLLSKNFDHILISGLKGDGPQATIGGTTFKFKPKVPVTAIIQLIKNNNNFDGMTDYITGSLVDKDKESQTEKFQSLLPDLDAEGLSSIMEWLTEASSGFTSDTSQG